MRGRPASITGNATWTRRLRPSGDTRAALPIAVAVAVLVARRYTAALRRSRAQVISHREYWQGRAASGTFRYIVLGDSTAQAVGVADPETGYVAQVERRLREATGRPVSTLNLSVSGATARSLLRDQLPLLHALDDPPHLVTCVVGGNDVAAPRFRAVEFAAAVDRIMAGLPRGSVVANIASFGHWPYEQRALAANSAIREAAARHGQVLADLHAATRPLWPWRYIAHLSPDLFHPNTRGYALWSDALWEAVAPLVGPAARGQG